jgi:hypothetical protein
MLGVIMLNPFMLRVRIKSIMLSVIMLGVVFDECHLCFRKPLMLSFAECRSAECHYTVCRGHHSQHFIFFINFEWAQQVSAFPA